MKYLLLFTIFTLFSQAQSQSNNSLVEQSCVKCHSSSANISFTLKQSVNVKLIIYNLIGQEIKTLANHVMTAGTHNVSWNWRDEKTVNGVYLYKLETEQFAITHKMTLVK
jgi:hypothetical protein